MSNPDYRARCAELVDLLVRFGSTFNIPIESPIVTRALAELAQREPVLTRPECFDFAMDFLGDPEETEVRRYVEALEARAAIHPVPTDKEWDALWDEEAEYFALYAEARRFGRAILARYARSPIYPVAVIERLPTMGSDGLDDQGTCWNYHPVNLHYCLCVPDPSVHTHWLPHHALPTP